MLTVGYPMGYADHGNQGVDHPDRPRFQRLSAGGGNEIRPFGSIIDFNGQLDYLGNGWVYFLPNDPLWTNKSYSKRLSKNKNIG